jgi:predicted dienelactone hydrolase
MRLLALCFGLAACSSNANNPKPHEDAPGGGSATAMGCDGATLLANPSDFAAAGPWPVGVKTTMVNGLLTEVWYPAIPGSESGKAPERYDIRTELSSTEAAKISDTDNPWQNCDCTRELPLDTAHGPYPAVVFVHGTASFRHQSLHIVTHWASRGFIVVAADHPGLKLGDLLAQACGGTAPAQDLSGNLDSLIAALGAPSGDLAFLAGHVDATRIAVSGHSAGGGAAAAASGKPGVQVVIPMAGVGSTAASSTLRSTLYMGGSLDSIASFNQVKTAYQGSAKPHRLVDVKDAGHLNFSDLCDTKNAAGQDLLTIANQDGICGANLAGFLFDCDPSHVAGSIGWSVINYASSAVLEQTLQCQPATDLAAHEMADPAIAEYDEEL